VCVDPDTRGQGVGHALYEARRTLCRAMNLKRIIAKWLLIDAALERGRWDMVVLILTGGLLAAVYVFRVLRQAFLLPRSGERRRFVRDSRWLEWTAFALAAASVLVGLRGMEIVNLLGAGGGA